MKKSKAITLVLVTALLGCNRNKPSQNHLYLRTDTSGSYTPARHSYHGYYIFSPYGMYYPYRYGGRAGYVRQGYSNAAVHTSSSNVSRGGFGRTGGFHASSST